MASSTLQITGTVTSTKTFAKTNAEVAQILEWFISDYAGEMPPEMDTVTKQNNWKLEKAHNKMIEYVVRESRRLRLATLRASQTDLETQAAAETSL